MRPSFKKLIDECEAKFLIYKMNHQVDGKFQEEFVREFLNEAMKHYSEEEAKQWLRGVGLAPVEVKRTKERKFNPDGTWWREVPVTDPENGEVVYKKVKFGK